MKGIEIEKVEFQSGLGSANFYAPSSIKELGQLFQELANDLEKESGGKATELYCHLITSNGSKIVISQEEHERTLLCRIEL